MRFLYLADHPDEFKDRPNGRRINYDFGFTQVDEVTEYLFFWSLIMTLAVGLITTDMPGYINEVMLRWTSSFTIFYFALLAYYNFLKPLNDDDFQPSGHVLVNLVAQAQHLCYHAFLRVETAHFQKKMSYVTAAVFLSLQVHACYSLFWTGFLFHTVWESLAGWAAGILICIASYESDLITNILIRLLETLGRRLLLL